MGGNGRQGDGHSVARVMEAGWQVAGRSIVGLLVGPFGRFGRELPSGSNCDRVGLRLGSSRVKVGLRSGYDLKNIRKPSAFEGRWEATGAKVMGIRRRV